jgi:hypothetical protein
VEHPPQIRPIVEAFSPDEQQIDQASAILLAAAQADWAPSTTAACCTTGQLSPVLAGPATGARDRTRCPPKWRGSDTACVPSSAFPSFSK